MHMHKGERWWRSMGAGVAGEATPPPLLEHLARGWESGIVELPDQSCHPCAKNGEKRLLGVENSTPNSGFSVHRSFLDTSTCSCTS